MTGGFLVIWDFGEGVAGAGLSALAAECAPDKHRGQVFALRSQVDSAVATAGLPHRNWIEYSELSI